MGALLGIAVFSFCLNVMDQSQEQANRAVQSRAKEAREDLSRPSIHFTPAAQWMNDPNGPIFFKGWYHMFYQHNPFDSQWNHMHWGHARSLDLVHWEHLPIALYPSPELVEDHIFSGSNMMTKSGSPVIFYTSISSKREPEQWAATPESDDLIRWSKHSHMLTQNDNDQSFAEWRDPFGFWYKGTAYLLTGGGRMGRGIVALYKAQTDSLLSWKQAGVFFTYPDSDVGNIECPNLIQIGRDWVLLVSVRGRVEAFVGQIVGEKFEYKTRGFLAEGSYASQVFQNTGRRALYSAWVNTSNHKAWNGYLILPSEMSISKDQNVILRPVKELQTLRQPTTKDSLQNPCEILAHVPANKPLNLSLFGFTIQYDPMTKVLKTNRRSVAIRRPLFSLQIFIDATALDVYANDGESVLCDHLDELSNSKLNLDGLERIQLFDLKMP